MDVMDQFATSAQGIVRRAVESDSLIDYNPDEAHRALFRACLDFSNLSLVLSMQYLSHEIDERAYQEGLAHLKRVRNTLEARQSALEDSRRGEW